MQHLGSFSRIEILHSSRSFGSESALLQPLKDAGYRVEPAADSPDDTVVVEIPVDAGDGVRTVLEVSIGSNSQWQLSYSVIGRIIKLVAQ